MTLSIPKQPAIAIVGRANVGKSTLFNRLLEKPKAIVSAVAGTTRDRNYGHATWQGRELILVDTGGLEESREIDKAIQKQVDIAIQKAELIIFLVDLKSGVMPQDVKIAKVLKRLQKPVILVGNKADTMSTRNRAEEREWLRLNFGKPLAVSASTGAGTGDLLDEILAKTKQNIISDEKEENVIPEATKRPIKLAIIGKPNVGKSSLLNSLFGEERVLVSDVPFTTHEPQDIFLTYNDQPFILIDTVGMRKRAHIANELETAGVKRSIAALEHADIALLTTEVNEPLTIQDRHLLQLILEKRVSLIILANKWDLVNEKDQNTSNRYAEYYHRFFPSLNWAPVLFISAKTGEKVKKILDMAIHVAKERIKIIPKEELDNFLKMTLLKHWSIIHEKKRRGNRPKIPSIAQTASNPPRFEITTTSKEKLPDGFVNFIEKRLREHFGFTGTPIHLEVRHLKKEIRRKE